MTIQLDHIFICASVGAREAERLTEFGLMEGPANTHPGQGTACRRFFFKNVYLELLWVQNADETRSQGVRETFLWERWSQRENGGCPFGFVFRPAAIQSVKPPFSTWEYHPPYLPPHQSIGVATNADLITEPALFWLGFATPNRSPADYPFIEHTNGLREVSRVELITPDARNPSPHLKCVRDTGLLRLIAGPEYRIELGFDGAPQGREKDFRPVLPLVVRW